MDSILYPDNGYETRVVDDGVAAVDLEEVRREKDLLRNEVDEIKARLEQREVDFFGEIHEVGNEVEVYRGKVVELQEENERLRACLEEEKVDFFKQVFGIEVEIYRERCKELETEASTVERILKNLRAQISQLRQFLEETRSEAERLQSLTEKQGQTIAENEFYIKELEERERLLTDNIEELLADVKETEEEVIRWKEACELEVEAGKNMIEERDKMDFILQQELEKTKAALEISNSKLKLKEDLVAAAMAAQAAAERSLQLADNRDSGLRERIGELTSQVEELESKERNRRKIRHICWPWCILKMANTTEPGVHNVKRILLPEIQALLQ